MKSRAADDCLSCGRPPKGVQQKLGCKADFSNKESAAQRQVLEGCQIKHAQILGKIIKSLKTIVEIGFNLANSEGVNSYSRRDGDTDFKFLARDTVLAAPESDEGGRPTWTTACPP